MHATDATNASRTLLFDIHAQRWDAELLRLFGIPEALLPEVRDNAAVLRRDRRSLLGRSIPIAGMAGDQQAALVGQACLEPGLVKSTYGTGCFVLLNTGLHGRSHPRNRMLTTVAYRLRGRVTYALEGAIFVAGAAVEAGCATASASIATPRGPATWRPRWPTITAFTWCPAFTGLGAPHWDPQARGLICGLTLDATADHLARAALEAVAYQTLDLADAMAADGGAATAARDPGRWRHGGERLVLPVPRRHAAGAGRASASSGGDGVRRRVPGRTGGRRMAGPAGTGRDLEPRRRLHAGHGGREAGAAIRRLAGRAGPGAGAAAVRRYFVCRWWPTSTVNGAVSVAPPRNEIVTGMVAPAFSAAVGFQQVRW